MKYLSDFEYQTLMAHLTAANSPRLILIELLARTGMRCEELIHVTHNAIDAMNFVYVKGAKGSLNRRVPLDEAYVRRLRMVLRDVPLGVPLVRAVSATTNEASQKRLLRKIWAITARECGIRLNVHGLRHTFAVRNLEQLEGPEALLQVKVIMGHKSISSTARYLDIIQAEALTPSILRAVGA